MESIQDLDESLVYEELADIRSAFEKLIDKFGYATVEDTMTKVVTVLEQFETLVSYKRQARLRLVNAELTLEEALYRTTHAYDPEGLLGCLTGIITVYSGVLAGHIIVTN